MAFANRSFGPAFEAIGFAPETTRINECARSDREDQRLPIEVWGLSGSNWDKAIAALAENVRSVLESSDAYMVEDRATGSSRRLRGSDIAILCRSNDRCGALSAALAARGLPVSIARPGLLETPEAALAIAALRYLVDPRDSLAIAEIAHLLDDGQGQPSWLESGLSDDGIWSLREDLPALKVLDEQREDLAYLTPREALAVAMSGSAILDRVLGWGQSTRSDRQPGRPAWARRSVRGRSADTPQRQPPRPGSSCGWQVWPGRTTNCRRAPTRMRSTC